MSKIQEILPGIYHWTAIHPQIHIEVSSYFLEGTGGGMLLDPMVPPAGLEWFQDYEPPQHILLSNRHHYRDARRYVEKFNCTVWCHKVGLHEFIEGELVSPFEFGAELPGGVEALEIGSLCPEETAYYINQSGGMVAFADGLVRDGDGPLSFVPDHFMGDDPEGVKAGLKSAFSKLMKRDFDHLLFAHGNPWIEAGKSALKEFIKD